MGTSKTALNQRISQGFQEEVAVELSRGRQAGNRHCYRGRQELTGSDRLTRSPL